MNQHSVLIAGQEYYKQGLLEAYLRREGFNIKKASDGIETLLAVSDKNLVLVVMDVRILKIDYIELCKQIRKFSDLPIVLLVEENEIDLGIAGLDAGPKAFKVLSANGVKVYSAPELAVQEAYEDFKNGKLGEMKTANVERHWF